MGNFRIRWEGEGENSSMIVISPKLGNIIMVREF